MVYSNPLALNPYDISLSWNCLSAPARIHRQHNLAIRQETESSRASFYVSINASRHATSRKRLDTLNHWHSGHVGRSRWSIHNQSPITMPRPELLDPLYGEILKFKHQSFRTQINGIHFRVTHNAVRLCTMFNSIPVESPSGCQEQSRRCRSHGLSSSCSTGMKNTSKGRT